MLGNDVHGTIQQSRQLFDEWDALGEKIVPAWKLDKEIDVAAVVFLATGDGAEHANVFCSELPPERFDGLTLGAQSFEQHAWCR